jgi:hypothetical protein
MNRDRIVELWERHTAYEFALTDANLAVSTMVDNASVMHLPTMSGGFGKERPGITEPHIGRDRICGGDGKRRSPVLARGQAASLPVLDD